MAFNDPNPPSGWDSALVAQQRVERVREKVFHRGASERGPRPDSISTDHLPTLVQGRDQMPSRCSCGSQFLTAEPPLGEHTRGTVTCGLCSRLVCWLAPPLVTLRPAPSAAPAPRQRVIAGRFHWTDGCGRACSLLYGHDAISHGEFGRQMVRAEAESKPRGVLDFGWLIVNFEEGRVLVDSTEPAFTAKEIEVVLYLASRVGQLVTPLELVRAVWGAEYVLAWSQDARAGRGQPWHTLTVNVSRIRSKLGNHRGLIETVKARGYRLLVEDRP